MDIQVFIRDVNYCLEKLGWDDMPFIFKFSDDRCERSTLSLDSRSVYVENEMSPYTVDDVERVLYSYSDEECEIYEESLYIVFHNRDSLVFRHDIINCSMNIELNVQAYTYSGMNEISAFWEALNSAEKHDGLLYAFDYEKRQTVLFGHTDVFVSEIVIPSEITEIYPGAFKNYKKLKSVKLSEELRELPKEAFFGCNMLSEINLHGIEKIGFDCFRGCKKLNAVELSNATYISGGAFQESGLIGVELPTSVEYLGGASFGDCDKLTNVILPENITDIKLYTFSKCPALKNIRIPASVRVIGESAFASCGLTQVTIPAGVEKIEEKAFAYSESLHTVIFESDSTEIGDYAFICTPYQRTKKEK